MFNWCENHRSENLKENNFFKNSIKILGIAPKLNINLFSLNPVFLCSCLGRKYGFYHILSTQLSHELKSS